jgi:DNA polymerase III delta subunit
MDAIPFLSSAKGKIGPLYIVFGDEAFLKRQVLRALIQRALGEDADSQSISTYAGDKATFAEVFDDL